MNVPVVAHESLGELPMNGYRPCVAMVVVNDDGLVLLARRSGDFSNPWQFPQGGIMEDEPPIEACLRELHEETGLHRDDVEVLAHAPRWIKYDLPRLADVPWNGNGISGQVQAWFLLRLLKDVPEPAALVDLAPDVEFDDYRWSRPSEAIEKVVEFKRPTYQEALGHFASGHMSGHRQWQGVEGGIGLT